MSITATNVLSFAKIYTIDLLHSEWLLLPELAKKY